MADEAADKTVSKQVDLSPTAREVLDTVKEKFGVTQKTAVERGLQALLLLPREVLQDVFAKDGDPWGKLVRLKLAEAVGAPPNSNSIDQAMLIIRQQLDRVENLARAYRRELEDEGGSSRSKKKSGGK